MPGLDLFLHDQFVGVVTPDRRDRSRVILDVDSDYTSDVLLSEAFAVIPSRRPPAQAVSHFLGGYMPEGNQRERMAAKRRIDKDDLFVLLSEFGGSVAGAVTLREQGEPPHYRPVYEPLDEHVLAVRLRQALTEADQGIPDDSRSTLPGYQPKVLAALFDGQWSYPHGRAHSTHILKPQVPACPYRIFDEHYSHLLANRVGLGGYGSEIRQAEAMTYLAIERFDRVIDGDEVRLNHQEDLAQAMGLDWRDTDVKFQEPDWPDDPRRATVRRMARLIGSIPGGGEAIEEWVRQLTFRIVIGDNDAHAKNVALSHLPGRTKLTPVYDAVPNLFQEGPVVWNMALAVDGIFDHRRISVEHLLAEIALWGVMSESRASVLVTKTLDDLASALNEVVPNGVSPGIVPHLVWNVDRLQSGYEIGEPKQTSIF